VIIKNDLVKGYLNRESSPNDLSSEKTSRGPNKTQIRKNSIFSKKSNLSKDLKDESFERSKILNISNIKSESNKKILLSNAEIGNSKIKNENDTTMLIKEKRNLSKKLSNLKINNSILKKSNNNLYLTKVDLNKPTEDIFNYEVNTFITNNVKLISSDEKCSSKNLNKVSFDELNILNFKKEAKITSRNNLQVLIGQESNITKDSNNEKKIKNKKKRSKKEKTNFSKSTAGNASEEKNLNETLENKSRENISGKKVGKKKKNKQDYFF